ncbi:MAG: PDZ domain-containing protein [Rhodobacteraceae bacterium]|nr:PDZ domain-containing protein [Paracoccaceae bacterium]
MDGTTLQALSADLAALTARAGTAVVAVEGRETRASGFVWRQGWVVTADEALGEEDAYSVTLPDGSTVAATLRGRDPSTDVALLKLEGDGGVAVGAPGVAAAGALALALGRAEGDVLAGFGVVTRAGAAWRSMRGGVIDARVELGLRLDRRAEGGLVIGMDGAVLGMAAFGPRRRALVIPMATVERVAAMLAERGRIARGYLGVGLQPVAVAGHDGMAGMVISLDASGPGAAAGLHQGDIIVSLDGAPIRRVQDLTGALGPDSVGRAMVLGLRRAGSTATVTVTVGERPAA